MGTLLRPLHLLLFRKPLAYDLIYRRFHKARRDRFLVAPAFAVIGNERLVHNDICVELVERFSDRPRRQCYVPIKKGSIVLFKPDQSTPLQQLGINRGYEARELPLLKRVVALAGDVVSVSSSGVSINGQLLPNSAPLFRDEASRPLEMAQLDHFRLGIDQGFLMGVTPTSWDSRYFGPKEMARSL